LRNEERDERGALAKTLKLGLPKYESNGHFFHGYPDCFCALVVWFRAAANRLGILEGFLSFWTVDVFQFVLITILILW